MNAFKDILFQLQFWSKTDILTAIICVQAELPRLKSVLWWHVAFQQHDQILMFNVWESDAYVPHKIFIFWQSFLLSIY